MAVEGMFCLNYFQPYCMLFLKNFYLELNFRSLDDWVLYKIQIKLNMQKISTFYKPFPYKKSMLIFLTCWVVNTFYWQSFLIVHFDISSPFVSFLGIRVHHRSLPRVGTGITCVPSWFTPADMISDSRVCLLDFV